MRSKTSIFAVLTTVLALLGLTAVSIAQDPTPMPAEIEPSQTITDVIGAPENYYGTTVSFDGLVSELVNVKAFVLDDEAFLGTNQVLVINNTGRELPIWITRDARVRVTGIVHPRTSEGGLDALIANSEMWMNETMNEPMVEATVEGSADMTPTVEGSTDMTSTAAPDTAQIDPMPADFNHIVQTLSYGVVPERLLDWTIIELISIDDLVPTE